jgi:membrane protease YdiL (CAAX protease family)
MTGEGKSEYPLRLSCWLSLIAATVLFTCVFTAPTMGFWLQLAVSTLLLTGIAFFVDGRSLLFQLRQCRTRLISSIAIGVASAGVLYFIFYAGKVFLSVFTDTGAGLVVSVYDMGEGYSSLGIGMILLLIVGPCEELFWRGFIQRKLDDSYGWCGIAMTILAYAAVHIAAGNPVLILAAVVCGTFWTLLLVVFDDIIINIVSHAVWAAVVFAFLPLA